MSWEPIENDYSDRKWKVWIILSEDDPLVIWNRLLSMKIITFLDCFEIHFDCNLGCLLWNGCKKVIWRLYEFRHTSRYKEKKWIFASSLQFFIFKIVNNYKIVCGNSEKKIFETRNANHKTSQSPISAVVIYTLY